MVAGSDSLKQTSLKAFFRRAPAPAPVPVPAANPSASANASIAATASSASSARSSSARDASKSAISSTLGASTSAAKKAKAISSIEKDDDDDGDGPASHGYTTVSYSTMSGKGKARALALPPLKPPPIASSSLASGSRFLPLDVDELPDDDTPPLTASSTSTSFSAIAPTSTFQPPTVVDDDEDSDCIMLPDSTMPSSAPTVLPHSRHHKSPSTTLNHLDVIDLDPEVHIPDVSNTSHALSSETRDHPNVRNTGSSSFPFSPAIHQPHPKRRQRPMTVYDSEDDDPTARASSISVNRSAPPIAFLSSPPTSTPPASSSHIIPLDSSDDEPPYFDHSNKNVGKTRESKLDIKSDKLDEMSAADADDEGSDDNDDEMEEDEDGDVFKDALDEAADEGDGIEMDEDGDEGRDGHHDGEVLGQKQTLATTPLPSATRKRARLSLPSNDVLARRNSQRTVLPTTRGLEQTEDPVTL